MDIPAADELEWLESNSLLPEFEDDEEDYIVVEEDEGIAGLREADRDRDAASENEIHKKRVRSEDKEDDGVDDEERGVKRREIDGEGEDEDWLRYSPPPKEAAAAADETTTGSDGERIISRFVSDIEGECVPITAPNGDRVYAKINSRGVDVAQRRRILRDKSANGWWSCSYSLILTY